MKTHADPHSHKDVADRDEPECVECGEHMSVPFGYEPTERCHGCAQKDSDRLSWLELQYVTVRFPARYGSREGFSATCGEENEPSDIRANIDAARQRQG